MVLKLFSPHVLVLYMCVDPITKTNNFVCALIRDTVYYTVYHWNWQTKIL